MKLSIRKCTSLVLCMLFSILHAQQALHVKELTLNNGMTVWLNEDHSQPKVFGAVVVKAGAIDCPDTGIAHYFEHIMFKGTDQLGTVDYAAERPWLDSIANQYELLAKTTDTAERNAIQHDINRLNRQAARYAIPNEFNRLTSLYGGSGLNAATSYDYTFYYNTFSPAFIVPWSELNSHRLIHPVFRLFQGELETVYEEKNRSADNPLMAALEHGLSEFCKDTPYEYPIIGSTENLKNPRMSEMEDFFRRYYVGCNMGLILCGDIEADTLQPLLERTFGQIPQGKAPVRSDIHPAALNGVKNVPLRVPIPLVKASVSAFRAPTDYEPDAAALDIATWLLSNENETGLLDSLTLNHKVMGAMATREAFNGIGALLLVSLPKLPFGSKAKAERKCWEQIERVKQGDFSESMLAQLKAEAVQGIARGLETIEGRSETMVNVFASGRNWEEFVAQTEAVKRLTKEDVVRVANRYFTPNHIRFKKKFGNYPKDLVGKPDVKPVVAQNTDSQSVFARRLERTEISQSPRLLKLDADAKRFRLADNVDFYWTLNPSNEYFDLTLYISQGSLHDRRIGILADYMSAVGTDSLSRHELNKAFQEEEASIRFDANPNSFEIHLSGSDHKLQPALRLLAHFLQHAKADEKALQELASSARVEESSLAESNESVLRAVLHKLVHGDKSDELCRLSSKELNELKSEGLIKLFRSLQDEACNIVYSGTLPPDEAAKALTEALAIGGKAAPAAFVYREIQEPEAEPLVYFFDVPKARQVLVGTLQSLPDLPDERDQAALELFADYLGGGMSSVLFQEIREFRSFAYSTQALCFTPHPSYHSSPSCLFTFMGTQADKTLQAIGVLDSVMQQLPLRQRNFEACKQEILNNANNRYPSFRERGRRIATLRRAGFTEDESAPLVRHVPSMTLADIELFHRTHIAGKPRTLIVIGSRKKLDLKALRSYGRLVELRANDVFHR